MKAWTFSPLLLAAAAQAHTIFQAVSVNGANQGQLKGVRSPSTNNPIYNADDANIACNTGLYQPVSTAVLSIPAGAQVGAWWQHLIGGPQGSNDADNPIASSHHGPIQAYLAAVSNAGTASPSGLKWFKIASDGLTNGVWGVDRMVQNGGWSYFTLPSCIAPGQYLLRVELLALHSAYNSGGSQFYVSCANIQVTGSGTFTGSNFLSFPGAYSRSDPGILLNIYGTSGNPDNNGKPYVAPGGAVNTCPSGGNPTTVAPTTTKPGTTANPTTTSGGGGCTVQKYGQCGGQGWTGCTVCVGSTCTKSGDFYSQCL